MLKVLLLTAALGGIERNAEAPAPRGHLVVCGGGRIAPETFRRILDVAGGPEARVVVVAQASRSTRSGPIHADRWRDAGAARVDVLDLAEPEAAGSLIGRADLIWFGDGSQVRLVEALKENGFVEVIRRRHAQGATAAGTSAGAAVMSEVMIAGNERRGSGAAGRVAGPLARRRRRPALPRPQASQSSQGGRPLAPRARRHRHRRGDRRHRHRPPLRGRRRQPGRRPRRARASQPPTRMLPPTPMSPTSPPSSSTRA